MTTIATAILAFIGGFTLIVGAIGIVVSFTNEKRGAEIGIAGILFLLFSALMFWLAGNV